MKQKTKGSASLFILIALAGALLLGVYAHNRAVDAEKAAEAGKLGAVVYTTQLTDTIGTFRNEVNSSTANLNAEVNNLSSTLSIVPVANGGTATSTQPTNYQFLSSQCPGIQLCPPSIPVPTWKTLTFGGGFNSTTTATSVTVGNVGFDATQSISFTGNNAHSSGTETFSATTTFTSSTILKTLPYGVVVSSGTQPISSVAPGSAGSFLTSNGSVWTSTPFHQASSGVENVTLNARNTSSTSNGVIVNSDGSEKAFCFYAGSVYFSTSDAQPHTATLSFLVDGVTQATTTILNAIQPAGQFGIGWGVPFITGTLSNGTHTIQVKAIETTAGGGTNPSITGNGVVMTFK